MLREAVVDLFCGVGGLTHGFELEGFNVIAGLDVDRSCRYSYEKNNSSFFIHRDIRDVTGEEISKLYPACVVKILAGCAPCQQFSSYTNSKMKGDKWKLLYEFSRIVNEVQPEIVTMENVPRLKSYKKYPVFDEFVGNLDANGYRVTHYMVYCPDYGIPQTRRRLVLFASKFGSVEIIEKTHSPEKYVTVRDAIGSLAPIDGGEILPNDPLHRARKLSELNRKRIMYTPPGGGWEDWPKDLVLNCHKGIKGKSFRSVYARMSWDKPAPTITTQCVGFGNGRFGHPEQHRAISLREASLIQTFQRHYDFIDSDSNFSIMTIARHIGNAVPVVLGRVIAKSIRKHLKEHYDKGL